MVFSGGFHGTPLCTNGSVGYLMQLSANGIKIVTAFKCLNHISQDSIKN